MEAAVSPCLIVLSGLPGTGKTTIARELVRRCRAFHVRIDTIESAFERSVLRIDRPEDAGYIAAYGVAADNLLGNNIVVADCVNPIAITRDAWAKVARAAAARLVEVEVICVDRREHRRRVETRRSDIDGLRMPSWETVRDLQFQASDRPHLVIDTSLDSPAAAAERIVECLAIDPANACRL